MGKFIFLAVKVGGCMGQQRTICFTEISISLTRRVKMVINGKKASYMHSNRFSLTTISLNALAQ